MWFPRLGYQTWTCGCGRHSLAYALGECPDCGAARPAGEPAAAGPQPAEAAPPAPAEPQAAAPAPARKRTRAATAAATVKGG